MGSFHFHCVAQLAYTIFIESNFGKIRTHVVAMNELPKGALNYLAVAGVVNVFPDLSSFRILNRAFIFPLSNPWFGGGFPKK